MLKAIGCFCILCGGVTAAMLQITARRRELETVRCLQTSLEWISDEIRLNQTPLPQCFTRLQQSSEPVTAAFFFALRRRLSANERPEKIWLDETEKLPEPVRPALKQLGSKLSSDEESLCRGLNRSAQLLDQLARQRVCSRREQNRRSLAMCLSGAALLILVLI